MMIKSSSFVFSGVPVGTATALPEGKYVPQLALSNFSNVPAHVRILYATTHAAGGVREIKRVFIPPAASMLVRLSDLSGDPDLRNSFVVTSDQAPGGVIANLVSTSKSRLPEVELLAKDEEDPENGGNHPWNLERGTESTLLLFNHSSDLPPAFVHAIIRQFVPPGLRLRTAEPAKRSRTQPPSSM
jgi:hypothetical protein